MSQKNTEYRSAKGKRLEGHGLAARMSQEILNSTLARAYVMVRSAGMQFYIAKLDGVPSSSHLERGVETINVIVVRGIVKKSWVNVP
jgi:hypothetical protein